MTEFQSIREAIAPTGCLRAAINLGNRVLVKQASSEEVEGLSVDLANRLAAQLGIPLLLNVVTTAAQSVELVRNQNVDVGFFAIDPLRGEGITFTEPYLLIEGSFMVRRDSALMNNDQVDQVNHRVVVGKASAYDLYLTRELKNAQIVRAASSQTVVDEFAARDYEVAAGVKQQLESDLVRFPDFRLLPGHFMVIQQAMGLPSNRGVAAAAYLRNFVEEMKVCRFVEDSLVRHEVEGASVAPARQSRT